MKKILFILVLSLMLSFLFMPTTMAALITVNDGADITLAEGNYYNVAGNATATLKGNGSTLNDVTINCSHGGVTLTFVNVDIDKGTLNSNPVRFAGSNNKLLLSGSNTLKGGLSNPGIEIEGSASLTIDNAAGGTGSLTAEGGSNSAGIGSSYNSTSGYITILGGNITAKGGTDGAGIGGGNHSYSNTIIISGGKVIAYGNGYGTGIGAGYTGDSGNISISNGAIVYAQSDLSTADIGSLDSLSNISISGSSTSVFTKRSTRSYKAHLYNNIDFYNDSTISRARSTYGLQTSPWTNAAGVYCCALDVVYEENGSAYGAPIDSNSPYIYDSTVTVLGATMAKDGYAFTGWNTQADGKGTHYDAGDTFDITQDTTLYAEWGHSLTYSKQSSITGEPPVDSSSPYLINTEVTVLGNIGTPALEKENYAFNGWNTREGGTGTHYDVGDTFNISENTTLYPAYAIWADDRDKDGVSDDDEGAFGTDPNDANDKPQDGTLVIKIEYSDNNPASGLIVVLNSSPETRTTDADGNAVFSGVPLTPHTVSIRSGTSSLGSYSLDFSSGTSNSTSVTGGGSGVNTTVNSNFLSLDFTVHLNGTNANSSTGGAILSANFLERSNTEGKIANPKTGDTSNGLWWLFAILPISLISLYFKKRVSCIKK